ERQVELRVGWQDQRHVVTTLILPELGESAARLPGSGEVVFGKVGSHRVAFGRVGRTEPRPGRFAADPFCRSTQPLRSDRCALGCFVGATFSLLLLRAHAYPIVLRSRTADSIARETTPLCPGHADLLGCLAVRLEQLEARATQVRQIEDWLSAMNPGPGEKALVSRNVCVGLVPLGYDQALVFGPSAIT